MGKRVFVVVSVFCVAVFCLASPSGAQIGLKTAVQSLQVAAGLYPDLSTGPQPIAMGVIFSDGSIRHSYPEGLSCYWSQFNSGYVITIPEELYSDNDLSVVTPLPGVEPLIPTAAPYADGDLLVQLSNVQGEKVQGRFQFVSYKMEPGPGPDLEPVKPEGSTSFCKFDASDRLEVHVKNVGKTDAVASTTQVDWGCDISELSTPAIPAGGTTVLYFSLPSCIDIGPIAIMVNALEQVSESDRGNNEVSFSCTPP